MNQAEVSSIRGRRLVRHVTPPSFLSLIKSKTKKTTTRDACEIHSASGIASRVEEVWCRHKGEKNLSTYKTAKIESGLILSPAVDRIIVISFSQFFDLHPFDVRH